jgi:AcrR family transcriptional regulator
MQDNVSCNYKLVTANNIDTNNSDKEGHHFMPDEQRHQPEKRTRLRGEERRALILQSAKHAFAHSTYADASTGELARKSEVTEPMLYKHFGSKKGLFIAVLREFGNQFFEALQARVTKRAEKDILDALTHIIDDYRSVIQADPEIQRILFLGVTEAGDPEIAQCIGKHNRRLYEFIRQIVGRAHEEGYLDTAISPDAVAWGYLNMILALQYALMLDLTAEIAPFQEEITRIWLHGLNLPEQ